ncbi:MAG: hypothetical protein LBC92_00570 [Rickettsiales bacterium]|jgi:hypothetical protein|nr:hypothetical protein [Rickettsiales bacterium]
MTDRKTTNLTGLQESKLRQEILSLSGLKPEDEKLRIHYKPKHAVEGMSTDNNDIVYKKIRNTNLCDLFGLDKDAEYSLDALFEKAKQDSNLKDIFKKRNGSDLTLKEGIDKAKGWNIDNSARISILSNDKKVNEEDVIFTIFDKNCALREDMDVRIMNRGSPSEVENVATKEANFLSKIFFYDVMKKITNRYKDTKGFKEMRFNMKELNTLFQSFIMNVASKSIHDTTGALPFKNNKKGDEGSRIGDEITDRETESQIEALYNLQNEYLKERYGNKKPVFFEKRSKKAFVRNGCVIMNLTQEQYDILENIDRDLRDGSIGYNEVIAMMEVGGGKTYICDIVKQVYGTTSADEIIKDGNEKEIGFRLSTNSYKILSINKRLSEAFGIPEGSYLVPPCGMKKQRQVIDFSLKNTLKIDNLDDAREKLRELLKNAKEKLNPGEKIIVILDEFYQQREFIKQAFYDVMAEGHSSECIPFIISATPNPEVLRRTASFFENIGDIGNPLIAVNNVKVEEIKSSLQLQENSFKEGYLNAIGYQYQPTDGGDFDEFSFKNIFLGTLFNLEKGKTQAIFPDSDIKYLIEGGYSEQRERRSNLFEKCKEQGVNLIVFDKRYYVLRGGGYEELVNNKDAVDKINADADNGNAKVLMIYDKKDAIGGDYGDLSRGNIVKQIVVSDNILSFSEHKQVTARFRKSSNIGIPDEKCKYVFAFNSNRERANGIVDNEKKVDKHELLKKMKEKEDDINFTNARTVYAIKIFDIFKVCCSKSGIKLSEKIQTVSDVEQYVLSKEFRQVRDILKSKLGDNNDNIKKLDAVMSQYEDINNNDRFDKKYDKIAGIRNAILKLKVDKLRVSSNMIEQYEKSIKRHEELLDISKKVIGVREKLRPNFDDISLTNELNDLKKEEAELREELKLERVQLVANTKILRPLTAEAGARRKAMPSGNTYEERFLKLSTDLKRLLEQTPDKWEAKKFEDIILKMIGLCEEEHRLDTSGGTHMSNHLSGRFKSIYEPIFKAVENNKIKIAKERIEIPTIFIGLPGFIIEQKEKIIPSTKTDGSNAELEKYGKRLNDYESFYSILRDFDKDGKVYGDIYKEIDKESVWNNICDRFIKDTEGKKDKKNTEELVKCLRSFFGKVNAAELEAERLKAEMNSNNKKIAESEEKMKKAREEQKRKDDRIKDIDVFTGRLVEYVFGKIDKIDVNVPSKLDGEELETIRTKVDEKVLEEAKSKPDMVEEMIKNVDNILSDKKNDEEYKGVTDILDMILKRLQVLKLEAEKQKLIGKLKKNTEKDEEEREKVKKQKEKLDRDILVEKFISELEEYILEGKNKEELNIPSDLDSIEDEIKNRVKSAIKSKVEEQEYNNGKIKVMNDALENIKKLDEQKKENEKFIKILNNIKKFLESEKDGVEINIRKEKLEEEKKELEEEKEEKKNREKREQENRKIAVGEFIIKLKKCILVGKDEVELNIPSNLNGEEKTEIKNSVRNDIENEINSNETNDEKNETIDNVSKNIEELKKREKDDNLLEILGDVEKFIGQKKKENVETGTRGVEKLDNRDGEEYSELDEDDDEPNKSDKIKKRKEEIKKREKELERKQKEKDEEEEERELDVKDFILELEKHILIGEGKELNIPSDLNDKEKTKIKNSIKDAIKDRVNRKKNNDEKSEVIDNVSKNIEKLKEQERDSNLSEILGEVEKFIEKEKENNAEKGNELNENDSSELSEKDKEIQKQKEEFEKQQEEQKRRDASLKKFISELGKHALDGGNEEELNIPSNLTDEEKKEIGDGVRNLIKNRVNDETNNDKKMKLIDRTIENIKTLEKQNNGFSEILGETKKLLGDEKDEMNAIREAEETTGTRQQQKDKELERLEEFKKQQELKRLEELEKQRKIDEEQQKIQQQIEEQELERLEKFKKQRELEERQSERVDKDNERLSTEFQQIRNGNVEYAESREFSFGDVRQSFAAFPSVDNGDSDNVARMMDIIVFMANADGEIDKDDAKEALYNFKYICRVNKTVRDRQIVPAVRTEFNKGDKFGARSIKITTNGDFSGKMMDLEMMKGIFIKIGFDDVGQIDVNNVICYKIDENSGEKVKVPFSSLNDEEKSSIRNSKIESAVNMAANGATREEHVKTILGGEICKSLEAGRQNATDDKSPSVEGAPAQRGQNQESLEKHRSLPSRYGTENIRM